MSELMSTIQEQFDEISSHIDSMRTIGAAQSDVLDLMIAVMDGEATTDDLDAATARLEVIIREDEETTP